MKKKQPKWQTTIWREWLHSEDEEYANHLFDLVADELVGWITAFVPALVGWYLGAVIELVICSCWWESRELSWQGNAWGGANDTDAYRRPRYRKMHVVVSPGCPLSENALRTLKNFFGQVSIEAEGERIR
jgi:hypothetical protein